MANRDDYKMGDSLTGKTSRAADGSPNVHGTTDTTGDVVGGTTGGVAGAATGAALGSLGGPIGTIIGGLAGAVGGWWSGRAISEAASTFNDEDDAYYQSHYQSSTGSGSSSGSSSRMSYNDARPAYQLGHLAGVNPDYKNRSFDDVEPHLQSAYSSAGHKNWSDVRSKARDAYSRGREVGDQRLTLAEEELRIGKRQVQAGEVTLSKTVETEHVSQTVPLMREEVTIERRPVTASDNMSSNVQISEDEIRIPLMAEEAVVEKRVVGKEEVVLHKEMKTENKTVEADLRKERLDVDRDVDTMRGSSASTSGKSGVAGSTGKGLGDRIADKADDMKDRVDGNPTSKPGRDSTDRPGR